MSSDDTYDVVIVGASLAGSAAAALLGRSGVKVALVEASKDPHSHKKLCTHYIQSSASATLTRLGLDDQLTAAGAVRNGLNMWTRFGWVRSNGEEYKGISLRGWNVRRSVIDPMIRELAAGTENVELMLGTTARELLRDGDRFSGVRVERDGAGVSELRAPLVIAADGRHSRVAKMAGVETKLSENDRFGYFAHYKGIDLPGGVSSQMWLLEPAVAYTFANDDGVTLLTYLGPKSELTDFKQDVAKNLIDKFRDLPDAPDLSKAEQVSEIRGETDIPNRRRKLDHAGLTFVGDAALASDPLWGIGCGWALQAGEWLAEETAAALRARDTAAIDTAVKRYARRHGKNLGKHDFMVRDFSRVRGFNPIEKILFRAAVADQDFADAFHVFGGRNIQPTKFMTPRTLFKAWRLSRRTPVRYASAEEAVAAA